MKRIRLLLKVWSLLFLSGTLMAVPAVPVSTEIDVTNTYLTNAGFDITCNYLFDAAASNLASANGGANIQAVTGWTIGTTGDNSAASSFEYGYAGTLNDPGNIPATDPDGATGTGEGTLGVSVAWGGTVTYFQTVTLPAGVYKLQYKGYNSGPATYDASQVGWVPDAGSAVLSSITDFTKEEWTSDVVNFTLTEETAGKIQVGLAAKGSGSGGHGRIFFDDIKLLVNNEVDKTTLQALVDSATVMYANQVTVPAGSTAYADLNSAITAAQVVLDNSSAVLADVVAQETAVKSAIATVYDAIELQKRITDWTSVPYDVTSAIENPSFETGTLEGWVNNDGFGAQDNTSFGLKDGSYYVEKWKSGGNWSDVKLYQTIKNIPNGLYKVTAVALNNPEATGGAFVYANDSTAEVVSTAKYTLNVVVENNTLEVGYNIVNSGNYIAVDDFRVTYLGDGVGVISVSETDLIFDELATTATFDVTGVNLTEDIAIVTPTGFSVDVASVAKDASDATVTVTFDASAVISDSISLTSGETTLKLAVKSRLNTACFTPLYTDRSNLISDQYLTDKANFTGWGSTSIVKDTIAYCGATCGLISGGSIDAGKGLLESNTAYRVKAMVNAASTDAQVGVYAWGDGNPGDINHTATVVGEWAPIEFTFTTLENPTGGLFFNNSAGSYIDNWELYKLSNDTTLDTLTISVGTLVPAFDSAVSVYSVVVPFTTTEVTVAGTPFNALSTVVGDGQITLTDGAGIAEVIVTAESGDTKTYTITFSSTKSTDATLSAILLDIDSELSPVFDAETLVYSAEVPVGIDSVIVSGTATYFAATVKADTVNVATGSGTASVLVTAEDGTEKTYTVNLTVADKFDNAALSLAGGDGNNSNVDISGLGLTTLPFTIEMWMQADKDQGANSALIYNRPGNVGLQYTSSWQSTSQSLRFMAVGGDEFGSPTVTADVTAGVWHHVAVVMTDSTRTVILDGVSNTEKATFDAIDWSAGLTYLGWDSDLAARAFDGLIDEVKVWNVAKTNDEISAGKFDILNGDEAGLVAYYNFDDQTSVKAANDLTGALDGVITGGIYVESNYQDLKTAAPSLTLSEASVVYVEKDLKQYPLTITTSNPKFTYSVSVPEGFTATPSVLTETDFTDGATTVMLDVATAEVGESGSVVVSFKDGADDIGLDTIGIKAVTPFTRYYIKNKATDMVLGSNADNALAPNRVDQVENDASQHFMLRPAMDGVDDSTYYIVQDVDYRYFSKSTSNTYSTVFGAIQEGVWKVVLDEAGGFYSLMNTANSKYAGIDDGNTGVWADKALVDNLNAEWLLEEVVAPAKKEVVFVTPSVTSEDTITIQTIAAYMDSSMYNVTVLAKNVIAITDTTQLNAADVVIMGRKINSSDVGTGAAVWDSITAPVISMNMYGLRGLANKAWWTPNASSTNVTSDADTVLQADILAPNDQVFAGTNAMTIDWWNGMFSVFGVDDEFTSAGNGQLLAKTSDNRPLFIRWAAGVEFYPEAGHAPNGDRTYIGCGNDNTQTNYFGFSDDAKAVFFAELARMASGEATVIPDAESKDATLSVLTSTAGTLDPVFDVATLTYAVELPTGTTAVPTLSATATDSKATVVINDATELPGSATVTVTAEFAYVSKTYTVNFTVLPDAVNAPEVAAVTVMPTVSADNFDVTAPLGSVIEVFDITGQLVVTSVVASDVSTVDVPQAGIYMIKVGNTVVKVVKTK